MKKELLVSELNGLTHPDVKLWIDECSVFWLSENQGPIWIADHMGLSEYVDPEHRIETRPMGEGVGNEGVEWNNLDFENPYHISDFTERIETINAFHF